MFKHGPPPPWLSTALVEWLGRYGYAVCLELHISSLLLLIVSHPGSRRLVSKSVRDGVRSLRKIVQGIYVLSMLRSDSEPSAGLLKWRRTPKRIEIKVQTTIFTKSESMRKFQVGCEYINGATTDSFDSHEILVGAAEFDP